jgi:hypothetical protein
MGGGWADERGIGLEVKGSSIRSLEILGLYNRNYIEDILN